MDAQFGDGRLDRLYRYWWIKRAGRLAPHRADLNPADIPDLLPIVHLIDVGWSPLSFRHRLVGTELVERLERDVTGKVVDGSLYGDATAEIVADLSRIATEIRPYRRRNRAAWHVRDWLVVESVEMPLIDDAGRVAMIFAGRAVSTPTRVAPEETEFSPLSPPAG